MTDLQRKVLERLQIIRTHGPQWAMMVGILDTIIEKLQSIEKMEGPQGPQGEPGESIVGPQGERGPQGPIGPQGAKGEDGRDGKDGNKGDKGDRGPEGKPGRNGVDGIDGTDGLPATPEEVIKAIQKEGLDAKYIKNIPVVTRQLPSVSLFPSRGGSKTLEVPGAGQDIRKIVFSGATVSRIGDGVAQVASTSGVGVTTTTSTASPTDTTGFVVLLCDCTGGNVTVNLPTAVGNIARFTVKKVDSSANTVTIDGSGTETIDGGTTATLKYQYESVDLVSDNSAWLVI